MTSIEFNEKYKDYLHENQYGLSLDNQSVIEYLDKEFTELVKIPNFKYSQIKEKFGSISFYCNEVSIEKIIEIEDNIQSILKKK